MRPLGWAGGRGWGCHRYGRSETAPGNAWARLERAAQLGSACAHFAIRQPGTQEYRYTGAELEETMRRLGGRLYLL